MKPKHANGKPDTRYTVALEHTGHPQARHVARWCGDWVESAATKAEAWALCRHHQAARGHGDAQ
jgi:hypothetical protein